MPTKNELRASMATGKPEAAAACKALAGYYELYYAGYNAILDTRHETNQAVIDEELRATGPDAAKRAQLNALLLELDLRLTRMDQQMLAFDASQLIIVPPTDGQVDDVKKLSAAVSVLQVTADAVANVRAALSKLLGLIGKVQGT